MGIARRSLHESALFWVALGGAVALIGGIPLGITVPQMLSDTSHPNFWANGWFDVGVAAIVLGCLMLLWAVVLFLAHHQAHLEMSRATETALSASTYSPPIATAEQAPPVVSLVAAPSPSLPPATPSPGREFCSVSPKELTRLYAQGGTELQSKRLIERYIGQWRQVSERVESVVPQNNVVTSVSGKDADAVPVTFFFDPSRWTAQLLSVMVGDTITAVGQIYLVTDTQVVLNECELVERSASGV